MPQWVLRRRSMDDSFSAPLSRHWFALALAALLSLLPPSARAADADSLAALQVRVYDIEQGLPHESVLGLATAPDGALWLGTWGGLARFDGFGFKVFDRATSPLINDNGILATLKRADGSIVVGTQGGGLLETRGDGLVSVVAARSGASANVLALIESAGVLFVGTEGDGLWRVHGGVAARVADPRLGAGASVLALANAKRGGGFYIGTVGGLYRANPDGTMIEAIALPHAPGARAVIAMLEVDDGTLYVGTNRALYARARDGTWTMRDAVSVQSLLSDRRGRLWVGTANAGLVRFDGTRRQQLGKAGGLPDNRVRALLEDADGAIWLGTNGGLVALRELPFRGLGETQGLSGDYVRSVLELDAERVLIATSSGVFESSPVGISRLGVSDGVSADLSALSLASDGAGGAWIGTYADGVKRSDGRAIRPAPGGLALDGQNVRALLRADDGSLWVGARDGIARFDASSGMALPVPVLPDRTTVLALHQAPSGDIYMGTTTGVRRLGADGQDVLALPLDTNLSRGAFAFLDAADGGLWIAGIDGLGHLRDGAIAWIDRQHGLPMFTVLQLARDRNGSLWLGSDIGLFAVPENRALAVASGRAAALSGRLFGRDDGMPTRQLNGGAGPSALTRANGELWFASARGVAIVEPSRIEARDLAPPKVLLERVAIDDIDQRLGVAVRLDPGRYTLFAAFSAVELNQPERVEFGWRWRDGDRRWRSLGAERALRLSDIAAGSHALEIGARIEGGEWTDAPAGFRFEVARALWERAWFYPLIALFAIAAIAFAFLGRTRALRLREAELSRRVDEQTSALEREMIRLAESDREKSRLLTEIERKSRDLERLAREDGLTGLANRRHFDERLRAAFASGSDDGPAVLLMDIDHFKQINDRYSHRVGDVVLQRFASILWHEFDDAFVGRYGGEEFGVVLLSGDIDAARKRAERFRDKVERAPWRDVAAGLAVTVSIGVAIRGELENADRLLSAADARLYEAKRGGRNRIAG